MGFLMLGGRMGDLTGHRTMLVAGIGVLAAASLVGGMSGTLGVLIAARAGQGFGAALAAPNALAILSRTFAEGPQRSRALGIFGAAGGTAAIALGLAVLVSVALGGTTDVTPAFHRSVLGAAIFAAASALAAIALLRPTEREQPNAPERSDA